MAGKRIEWTEKLLIGVPRIDFEHQIFADLINSLAERVEQGADRLAIVRTLREVLKYAEFHFVSEENLMVEANYPRLREHAAIHQRLLQTLTAKSMALAAQEIDERAVLDFLVNWFVEHTAREDPLFAAYVAGPRN